MSKSLKVKVLRQVMHPTLGIKVPLIDVQSLVSDMKEAEKTRPIWAAPSMLMVHSTITSKVNIMAIEGNEVIRPDNGAWICKGDFDDFWLQEGNKLFGAYKWKFTDEKGWSQFDPLPDVHRLAILVTMSTLFASHAQWGAVRDDTWESNGKERWIQFSAGPAAYIVRNMEDPTDFWQVVPNFFTATYEMKSEI